MHAKHVTEHKIDCLDCHLRIEHSLDKDKIVHAAGDCQSCHPNHHREQVDMLLGKGGRTVAAHDAGMARFRVECKSCHQEENVSATGDGALEGNAPEDLLAVPRRDDRQAVPGLPRGLAGVLAGDPGGHPPRADAQEALPSPDCPRTARLALAKELRDAQHDLDFLRVGNDVHNMHYATKLNQALVERVAALCRELKVAEPKVALPALPKAGK